MIVPTHVFRSIVITLATLAVVVLWLPFSAELVWSQNSAAETVVIEGGLLIDGTGAPPRRISALVIAGDRIKEIVPEGVPYQPPPLARRVSAMGLTIIPGLFDSHFHSRDYDSELLISHGITSVLDLGNNTDWILAQKEGEAKGKIFGPRRFMAGAIIGIIKGQGFPKHRIELNGTEDATRAAREMIALGVDLIKVGNGITPAELRAVVAEAHKAGRNVIGHIETTNAREAAEAGINALAHISGVARILAPDLTVGLGSPLPDLDAQKRLANFRPDPGQVAALAKLLVDSHVTMEPDLILKAPRDSGTWLQFVSENYRLLGNPQLKYIPEVDRERWLEFRGISDSFLPRSAEEQAISLAASRRMYEIFLSCLKQFIALGGQILAGTDGEVMGVPGLVLHQELQLLVEDAGMSPMDALLAATRNPAKFIHREKDLGTVEAGKLADLVLVRGNPLENIRNADNVEAVFKGGKPMATGYHASYQNPIPRRPAHETASGAPVPFIQSIRPTVVEEGAAETQLTITGSGFVPGCVVTFKGRALALLSGSRAELQVKLEATDLKEAGAYPVVVSNPSPGGGPSVPVYVIVKFR